MGGASGNKAVLESFPLAGKPDASNPNCLGALAGREVKPDQVDSLEGAPAAVV